jgi:hypothetical protein
MEALGILQYVAFVGIFVSALPSVYFDYRLRELLWECEPETFTRIRACRGLIFFSMFPVASRAYQLYIRRAEFRASTNVDIREAGEWLLRLQYGFAGSMCFIVLSGLARMIIVGS